MDDSDTVFVDSNIPMYLVGAAHPNKAESERLVQYLVLSGAKLVTDAEVLQEILHRYTAIRRKDAIEPAISTLIRLVDEVWPVRQEDVLHAAELIRSTEDLTARDALHLSMMHRYGISKILTFDSDFDHRPGIERIPGVK